LHVAIPLNSHVNQSKFLSLHCGVGNDIRLLQFLRDENAYLVTDKSLIMVEEQSSTCMTIPAVGADPSDLLFRLEKGGEITEDNASKSKQTTQIFQKTMEHPPLGDLPAYDLSMGMPALGDPREEILDGADPVLGAAAAPNRRFRVPSRIGQFEDIGELLIELQQAFEARDLSEIQYRVIQMKLNVQPTGSQNRALSNAEILRWSEEFGAKISCNKALVHCILRTVHGRFWEPGMTCGRNHELGEIDQRLFRENIVREVQDYNCVTTFQARTMAFQLRRRRFQCAMAVLIAMGEIEYLRFLEDPTV
jgi:hypothetical protein